MERRYIDSLNLKFDEVADQGFTTISHDEVMRWWDRQRETPTIWQDMQERWDDRGFVAVDGTPVGLLISYWKHTYTLAWAEPEWLVPLSDWARTTSGRDVDKDER